jgi:hypothetical protein
VCTHKNTFLYMHLDEVVFKKGGMRLREKPLK